MQYCGVGAKLHLRGVQDGSPKMQIDLVVGSIQVKPVFIKHRLDIILLEA